MKVDDVPTGARDSVDIALMRARFEFAADANFDGSVTVTDVWLWVKWLYWYPGDLFVAMLWFRIPGVADFFEISRETYYGGITALISLPAWVGIVLGIAGLIQLVTEFVQKRQA